MGVEACFWGVPAILIGRAYYEDLDCCYRAFSHQEVIDLISQKLLPKPKKNAFKYGCWRLSVGIPYKRYQACPEKNGSFMGHNIKPRLNRKEQLILRSYYAYKKGLLKTVFNKCKRFFS
jgi:hypothetical protein